MKLLPIIIALMLCGCRDEANNELKTRNWLKQAEYPVCAILWEEKESIPHTLRLYTLIDANGELYMTGSTRFIFPDTIRKVRVEEIDD